MKKILFFVAIGLLALSSCSKCGYCQDPLGARSTDACDSFEQFYETSKQSCQSRPGFVWHDK